MNHSPLTRILHTKPTVEITHGNFYADRPRQSVQLPSSWLSRDKVSGIWGEG